MQCLIGGTGLDPPRRRIGGASAVASIPARCSDCNCSEPPAVVSLPRVFSRTYADADLLKCGQNVVGFFFLRGGQEHVLPEAWFQGRYPTSPEASATHRCPEEEKGERKARGTAYTPAKHTFRETI